MKLLLLKRWSASWDKRLLAFLIIFTLFGSAVAQQSASGARKIGTVKEFRTLMKGLDLAGKILGSEKKELKIKTTDLDLSVRFNLNTTEGRTESFAGSIGGSKGSHVLFSITDGKLEGSVEIPAKKKAYKYYSDAAGNIFTKEVTIDSVLCVDYKTARAKSTASTSSAAEMQVLAGSSVYTLQSLPGARNVAFLDFDGHYYVGSRWNGGVAINAPPISFTDAEILEIWKSVGEDYAPFNVNITTDESVFQGADIPSRQRVIITSNDIVAVGAGGIAHTNSFGRDNDVCWVFTAGIRPATEGISHELGHTLGLQHDGQVNMGDGYYEGHGIWAPIMGYGVNKTLTQWSINEYPFANNTLQDDVAIIAARVGQKADDAGNTTTAARSLVISTGGVVSANLNAGLISARTDVDVYSFTTTTAGTVSLTVASPVTYTNLDVVLKITNAAGTTLASSDPATTLGASVSASLPAGTYYLHIDGTGYLTPTTGGYSDYGSLGAFTISGTVPGGVTNIPPTVSVTSPLNGAAFVNDAVTITAAAADADGTIAKVEFWVNADMVGSDATAPYSFTGNIFAYFGEYYIKAVATDNNGAVTTSALIKVLNGTINKTPTVTITSPADGTLALPGGVLVINATAADYDGTVSKVDFYNGATLLGSDAAAPYSFTINATVAGTYNLRAVVTDNLNATGSSTVITYNVGTPPAVSITYPVNGQTVVAGTTLTFLVNATDADGTISKVIYYNNAGYAGETAVAPFSKDQGLFVPGTETFYVEAYDNQNNITRSASVALTVVPSIAPTVSITSPSAGATFAAGASITINTTAADADGTISMVQFFNGNTFIGSDDTAPFSFTITGATAGTYDLNAIAIDNSGGNGYSTIVRVTVGGTNTAPVATITSPANNATFTTGAAITINATATDTDGTVSKVDFYNGTTLLGTDATSPYSFVISNAAAGTYTLKAVATDNLNATGTSSVITVTVSNANTAPVATITSPANNATFTTGAAITINATATDADGTVSKVDFYNGTTLLGTDATSPYSFVISSATAGTYTLKAVATDNLNATGTSSVITVTVSNANTAPVATITSPANNATFTTGAAITINATASDANGTVSKVDFYNGTTLLGSDATSPYSFVISNAAAGTYTLKAVATDNLNATGTSSVITVTVSNANTAPVSTIISPANNATFTTGAAITINATATDADGTVSKVDFYNGTTLLGSDATSPYSFVINSAAAGTYTLKAVATDNLNATGTSSVITVTVSNANTAPVATITSPANNASYLAGTAVTINATASDADGTVTRVEFYNGTTLLGSDLTAPYSFQITNAAIGDYNLKAVATDNLGLSGNSSVVTISFRNYPPVVWLSSPQNGFTYLPGSNITIQASTIDSTGTVSKVDFYNGTTLLGSDLSAPFSYVINAAVAGAYNIKAVATDNYGAQGTSSIVSINVSTNNSLPAVSISAPSAGQIFDAGSTINITASASDIDGTIAKVDFYNGSTLLGSLASSPWSVTLVNATAGSYALKAVATDNLGGMTTSGIVNVSVITPNQLPVTTITSPTYNQTIASGSNVVINATATDADGTITKVDFYNESVFLGSDLTAPYSFTWTSPANGHYFLRAIATDNSGKQGLFTSVYVYVGANVLPAVSITAPAGGQTFAAGASIAVTANATDADGFIYRVNFYNGSTLLGYDTLAPYTCTIANAAAGTYNLKATALDDRSGTTTSAVVTITVGTTLVPGVNGPACVTAGQSNLFTFMPEAMGYTSISWYSNGSGTFTADPADNKKVNAIFTQAGTFTLTASVNLPVSPWYKTYTKTVTVGGCTTREADVAQLIAAPHPFADELNISLDNGDKIISVKIYDVNGKELYKSGVLSDQNIMIGNDLSEGVYMLQVITENNQYSKRILKTGK